MSRWKGLPEGLDPRVRQVVVQLRRLKDHSGLSLAQIAAKTGYSRSSWERYLGGRQLPPEAAVEELARVAGADPARLLALREVAAAAWGRSAPAAEREPGPLEERKSELDPGPAPGSDPRPERNAPAVRARRAARPAVVAGGVAVTVALAGAVLVAAHPWRSDTRGTAAAPTATRPVYTCHVERKDGVLYAGNSTTRDAILQQGMVGPDVAEAQCLLRNAGFSPGDIDGVYGDLTERAVKRVQQKAHLVVDGKVGPHTWGALRG